MISAEEAKSLVLRMCEASSTGERFAIQSCDKSPCNEYWVIRANSEDYVVHGIFERCYVGVNAHLVNATSGVIESVGSRQSWEQFLQDKHDLENAAGLHYVLEPAFEKTDKVPLINLRQRLELSYQDSILLLLPENRQWLTGKFRVLKDAQKLLQERGIVTVIVLRETVLGVVTVKESALHWDALVSLIRG